MHCFNRQMPRVSKRKMQSRKANEASMAVLKRKKLVCNIYQELIQRNNNELQQVYQYIIQQTKLDNNEVEINEDNEMDDGINNKKVATNTRHQKLIKIIEKLLDDQLKSAIHLLNNMRYPKGPNEGNLLSPFLQKKALDSINSSLYKVGQDTNSLIQNNQALQKKVTQLECSNAKKNLKIKQLTGKLIQHKRKQCQHISKICATARKPLLADS
jgi:hypothetical protein